MSLSAGRVGVRADQVDSFGRVNSPSFFNEIMENLPEWTDLPVRVNGTEQLIPSNPSVPVTSPILADIDYPDERRNDQYFTYRESPTTVDGLAKIKDIKGNTLVWNQLNSPKSATVLGVTVTVSNGKYTVSGTGSASGGRTTPISETFNVTNGHKYLLITDLTQFVSICVTGSTASNLMIFERSSIQTATYTQSSYLGFNITSEREYNQSGYINLFDLTQMFGAGNEPTTVDEFTSLFPLPYYAYNSGSLLSFNGTDIKTVGFNQWDEEWELGGIGGNGDNSVLTDRIRSKNYIKVLPTATYYYRIDSTYGIYTWGYDENKNYVGRIPSNGFAISNGTVKIPSNVSFIRFVVQPQYGTTYKNDICINISSSRNGEYEPYEENTTNLPTETYFPTGMKSAGSVYDELTPTKAVTRIGAVDLGTLTWTYDSTVPRFYTTGINSLINKPVNDGTKANAVSMYTNTTFNQLYVTEKKNMTMAIGATGTLSIINTSYSNATAFKTAMNGVYLYYELATPIELPTLSFE